MRICYEVRARIDPIVPVEGWKDRYSELVGMMDEVPFSRVTLGMLRGLQRTIIFARKLGKDMSWTDSSHLAVSGLAGHTSNQEAT
jgi:spore photoproduct lyase